MIYNLITFCLLFIIIFIIDYFFIKRKYVKKTKRKKKKKNELMEITYLVNKFKLDKDKLPMNKLVIFISLINALIISLVASIIFLLKINIIWQLLIGFILLLALIYAMYELLGKVLERRGYKKNGI